MLIFLYGTDTYRSQKKLKEIISRYKEIHKSGLNFQIYDASETDFAVFKSAIETISMFAEKKLIVLKNAMSYKDASEKLMAWEGRKRLEDSKDVICVFWEKEIDKKSSPAKWLVKNSKCQEFEELTGVKLRNWALSEAKGRGVSMDSASVFTLINLTGGNLWALEKEISKLCSYARATKKGEKIITKNDISLFIGPRLETHIFELVDSFVGGDRKRALRLLHSHLESGDNERQLFSLIQSQFRNIVQVHWHVERGNRSQYNLAKTLKIHPFVAKKSIDQAGRMSRDQIKNIYEKLVDIDMRMKTGTADARAELERLVI